MKSYKVAYVSSGSPILSNKALKLWIKLSGKKNWTRRNLKTPSYPNGGSIKRHDPILIEVIETLGKDAGPPGCSWEIHTLKNYESRYLIIPGYPDGEEIITTTCEGWVDAKYS